MRFSGLVTLLSMLSAAPISHADFVFENFTSTGGLQLNGDATRVDSTLRISESAVFSTGSVFTTDPISLRDDNSFSTHFQFRIWLNRALGDGDGPGADGLVFVMQTVSNSVGVSGGGIGYSGISPSVGIEFDTFNNGPLFGDPDGNHVGIDVNGDIISVATMSESVRFNNAQVWDAWIDYDGITDALDIRWSMGGTRPIMSQLSYDIDIASLLGQDSAFVGFTSATGDGYGHHELHSWEFRDDFSPIGIPEPSVLMPCIAASGLISIRRKNRMQS